MSERILRQSPPRSIDLVSRMVMLLGGIWTRFGLVFLVFSSIFVWIFVGNSTVKYLFQYTGNWSSTTGTVFSAEGTNMSEGNSTVYRHGYRYTVNGQSYTGTAYSTGIGYDDDQEVTIKYNPHHPDRSLLVGARRAPFGFVVALVLLFPLVGGIMLFFGLRQNIHFLQLLEVGIFTRGELKSKTVTGTKINDQSVYAFTFDFPVGSKTYQAVGKTHMVHLLEDEPKEIILYDPLRPERNIVYDAYPQAPDIDNQGYLVPRQPWELWPWLLVILLAISVWFGLPIFFY